MKRKPYIPWTDAQFIYATELMVEFGTSDWAKITRLHNKKFDVKRTRKSMVGMYRRLRDAANFHSNKALWKIIEENPRLFNPEKAVKKSYGEKIKSLESRLDKKDEQIEKLMAMLEEKTRPGS